MYILLTVSPYFSKSSLVLQTIVSRAFPPDPEPKRSRAAARSDCSTSLRLVAARKAGQTWAGRREFAGKLPHALLLPELLRNRVCEGLVLDNPDVFLVRPDLLLRIALQRRRAAGIALVLPPPSAANLTNMQWQGLSRNPGARLGLGQGDGVLLLFHLLVLSIELGRGGGLPRHGNWGKVLLFPILPIVSHSDSREKYGWVAQAVQEGKKRRKPFS